MKKPKIRIEYFKSVVDPVQHEAWIRIPGFDAYCSPRFETAREAREWAKDWCRTVGAALMEKGK